MDCPNCGAYNASSSIRCRRCNQILPGADDDSSAENERGSSAGSEGRWDEHFRQDPSQSEPTPETPSEQSWDWSEPGVSGQSEPSEWEITQPADRESSYPDPFGDEPVRVESDYGGTAVPVADIPNYLWPSIGATICCCAPLGIPAIVFASRVDAFKASGDLAAAEEASNKAKMWSLAAFGVAILFWIAIFCAGQFTGDTPV